MLLNPNQSVSQKNLNTALSKWNYWSLQWSDHCSIFPVLSADLNIHMLPNQFVLLIWMLCITVCLLCEGSSKEF